MVWEMCLVVSVYKRQFWEKGLTGGELPDHEQVFKCPLPNGWDDEELSKAMRDLVSRTEKWLNAKQVRLVTHLVVTVYSLEVI